jgi:hydrogenase maturation protein HypF
VKNELPAILAVGAHQKNNVAATVGRQVFVSQHIGDLETQEAFGAFEKVIESFEKLYEFTPKAIACDLHPNYMSTEHARRSELPVVGVQHHYAHVLACMAENEIDAPVLGISWDGSGYGTDGTVWGGEFLWVDEQSYERVAHLRGFLLPGSEKAVKEPRRSAAGLLREAFGKEFRRARDCASLAAFTPAELKTLTTMLESGLTSPRTSSAGRLFDAIASLLGLRQTVRFEGQAAMQLEALASEVESDDLYEFELVGPVLDWGPMVASILDDMRAGESAELVARKFHNTLAEMMVRVAETTFTKREGYDEKRVALTGGCFQNRLLTETAIARLSEAGFRTYWHQRIPPNDGGIALGQIMAAARELRAVKE